MQHPFPIADMSVNQVTSSIATVGSDREVFVWSLGGSAQGGIPGGTRLPSKAVAVRVNPNFSFEFEHRSVFDLSVDFSASAGSSSQTVLAPLGVPFDAVDLETGRARVAYPSPGAIVVVDPGSGQTVRRLGEKTGRYAVRSLWSLALSPDGNTLVCSDSAAFFSQWDLATGELRRDVNAERGRRDIVFDPTGTQVVFTQDGGPTKVADLETGIEALSLFRPAGRHPTHLLCTTDGRKAFVYGRDPYVRVWDLSTGEEVMEAMVHEGIVRDVTLSADGTRLATASKDGVVRVWEADTGRPLSAAITQKSEVIGVAFSPDGNRLATMTLDGVRVWDIDRGIALTPLFHFPVPEPDRYIHYTGRIVFSPDGNKVAAADLACVCIFDAPVAPAGAPGWLPDLLEAIAMRRFNHDNHVEVLDLKHLDAVRLDLMSNGVSDGDGFYEKWLAWFLEEPSPDKRVSPFSEVTFSEFQRRLRDTNTVPKLTRALHIDPNDALSHALLAERLLETNDDAHIAKSRSRWHAEKARQLGGGDSEVAEILQRIGPQNER